MSPTGFCLSSSSFPRTPSIRALSRCEIPQWARRVFVKLNSLLFSSFIYMFALSLHTFSKCECFTYPSWRNCWTSARVCSGNGPNYIFIRGFSIRQPFDHVHLMSLRRTSSAMRFRNAYFWRTHSDCLCRCTIETDRLVAYAIRGKQEISQQDIGHFMKENDNRKLWRAMERPARRTREQKTRECTRAQIMLILFMESTNKYFIHTDKQ